MKFKIVWFMYLLVYFKIFEAMQKIFVDINECVFVNGGCEDICVNTIGSYHCNCGGDAILAENGLACKGRS